MNGSLLAPSLQSWRMAEVHIGLPWWPPSPDEPIGADRARELVERLKVIADAVVQAAEADLRMQVGSDIEILRGQVPPSYFARGRLTDEMRSLCIGVVYQAQRANAPQNSIQLHRDGAVTPRSVTPRRWHSKTRSIAPVAHAL